MDTLLPDRISALILLNPAGAKLINRVNFLTAWTWDKCYVITSQNKKKYNTIVDYEPGNDPIFFRVT